MKTTLTIDQDHRVAIPSRWIAAAGGYEVLDAAGIRPADGAEVIPFRFKLRKDERRALKKKKFISPSTWAEHHRTISKRFRYSGRWSNATVPYLAGIMDASFFKSVEEIGICAVPQSGKTEGVYTCIGYATDLAPGDVMVLFPNETDAKDNAKDRIKPMYEDSPRLRRYLTGYMDDMGAHKLTLANHKIYMAWANSPARLSNRPCKYGYSDEEEKHPETASKKEASSGDLLKKRTTTYEGAGRKIWRTSSPTIESGPIWRFITKEAHAVYDYWVRCPECGGWQLMRFEKSEGRPGGFCWTKGVREPKTIEQTQDVWYECEKCRAHWDDHLKKQAVRDGQWRDRETGLELLASLESRQPLRIGFHIPGWISPFIRLYEIAAAFLKGQKGQPDWINKLKDFRNGFCAEPWEIIEAKRQEDHILKLKDESLPAGMVPGGGKVAALMAGIDTQDDGFWYEIRAVGYGMSFDSWSIRNGFVTSFEALKQILWDDVYKDAEGNVYPVRLATQDAMGHRTSDVYDFCRLHRGMILPSQGKDRQTQPFAYSNIEYYPGTKKPIPGGLQLVRLDTNFFKNHLQAILEVAPGDPGCWYYNSELTLDWALQMTAEGVNPQTGKWENPKNKPNHAWDCSVLILLAVEILGIRFMEPPHPAELENQNSDPNDSEPQPRGRRW